jgi:type I restriction enzyme S subunit
MGIARGLKKTDFGMISSDWITSTVGDMFTFEGGSQPDKSYFSHTRKPGYIRLIQIRDYKTDRFETYIPQNMARRFCNADDIMIGRYGPPIFQILRGIEGAYNVALIKATPSNDINKTLAYYFLKQDRLFNFIDKLSQRSSGQTGVDLGELRQYPFPIPPTRAEQEAIANALSDADAYIESLGKLIEKKRLIKKGAMQELLTGKRRLPGFGGSGKFKDTEVGLVPEDWQVKLLPEVCRFRSGKAHEQYIVDDGKYVCVNSKFISTDGQVRKYSSANFCAASRNDILMVMSDLPNGKALAKVFMVDRDNFYAVNQRVCALTPYKDDPEFVGLQLNRNPYFLKFDDGVSQTHLLNRVFEKCPLILPNSIEEQRSISKIISEMTLEINGLESKLAKAHFIKQGMVQELLTGRIRLV